MTLRHSLLLIVFASLVSVLIGSGDGNRPSRTAQILEIDEKTVKSRLFEARRRLRGLLKDWK